MKYSHIEGLTDKENFELLRKVLEYKDRNSSEQFFQSIQEKDIEIEALRSSMMSKELLFNDLDSKRQNQKFQTLEEALLERENDIKDLLKDYEKLQTHYQELEKAKSDTEQEVLQLREKLAYKSNQLVNIYQAQEFNSSIPDELNSLRKQYLELIDSNQFLQSKISVVKSRGADYSEILQQFLYSSDDKESLITKIEESFKNRMAFELENLESYIVNELRKQLNDIERTNLEMSMHNNALRIEAVALRNLLDEEKKSEKEAKGNKNE